MQKLCYTDTINKKQWWSTDKNFVTEKEFLYKYTDWFYEKEYRIVTKTGEEYFGFDQSEIAVVIFGDKIDPEVKTHILKSIPQTCDYFDLKADKNRSQYYLPNGSKGIYTVEELIKHLQDK